MLKKKINGSSRTEAMILQIKLMLNMGNTRNWHTKHVSWIYKANLVGNIAHMNSIYLKVAGKVCRILYVLHPLFSAVVGSINYASSREAIHIILHYIMLMYYLCFNFLVNQNVCWGYWFNLVYFSFCLSSRSSWIFSQFLLYIFYYLPLSKSHHSYICKLVGNSSCVRPD
jgi:uncharacterized membrane protein